MSTPFEIDAEGIVNDIVALPVGKLTFKAELALRRRFADAIMRHKVRSEMEVRRKYEPSVVLNAVCHVYGVARDEIYGPARDWHRMPARRAYCWVMRERAKGVYSWKEIVRGFGAMDHTSGIHHAAHFDPVKEADKVRQIEEYLNQARSEKRAAEEVRSSKVKSVPAKFDATLIPLISGK
jgi:chromosomal replication initiation ATPase DnaA